MHIPTKLVFGCGEIKKLATEKLPGKKAMIVISSGTSMKKYGYLDKVINLLTENDTASIVYDKILPNPIKSHVMELLPSAVRGDAISLSVWVAEVPSTQPKPSP